MSKVNDLKEVVSKLTPKDFASDQDNPMVPWLWRLFYSKTSSGSDARIGHS